MEMAEDMEQTEVSRSLPEVLVEKIIAMMPFPLIFKARALSKSWRDRFSPISSSRSGEEKSLAVAAFQRQVGQWSTKWKTFSPVLRAWNDLVTYDRAAPNWLRLRSMLSFLQDCPLCSNSSLLIEGALCYGFPMADAPRECMVVANILTRSWRLLPPRPNASRTPVLVLKLVVYPSLEMYKVILFCKKGRRADHYYAQIYNSKSGAWKSKEFRVSSDFRELAAAYLNGILYMVGMKTPQSLLAFNVEEETLEELRFSFDGNESLRSARVNMVICNVNWLMLVAMGEWNEDLYDHTIEVFRIDLGSLQLMRLPHGPPAFLNMRSMPFLRTCGDGNCIFFFGMEQYGSRAGAYNVDEYKWSPVPVPTNGRPYPMCESSFQPGLSPFMAV